MSDITKLKAAGIVTVLGVAQTPRKNLAKIKASSSGFVADDIGTFRSTLYEDNPTDPIQAKIEKLKASPH